MNKQMFGILSILMMLAAVSQAGLLPRGPDGKESSSGDEDPTIDSGFGWRPEVSLWPGLGEPDLGIHRPSVLAGDDYDENIDENESREIPLWSSEGSERDENMDYDASDETDSRGNYRGDYRAVNVDTEYDGEGPEVSDADYEMGDRVDEFSGDENNNIPTEEGNGEIGSVPMGRWHNTNNVPLGDENGYGKDKRRPWFFVGGSLFDSPFFNLEPVRKYLYQLEKSLEHLFRQTLDEARLLNNTYANKTEEEVDIGGKKYVVQKSVIEGGTNNSGFYVKTLSTKPKEEGIQEPNIPDAKE